MSLGCLMVGRARCAALTVLISAGAARATTEEGIRALRAGDAENAAVLFRQALDADPTDAEAAFGLGQALAKLGRSDEAEIAIRRAIDLAPVRPAPYARLADLVADDPGRWQRRDEVAAVVARGLARVAPEDPGRLALVLSVANFERSIGRTASARRRVEAIDLAGLSLEQKRRVLSLLESIELQERGLALRDWPEPEVPPLARQRLSQAEARLADGDPTGAVSRATPLVTAYPGWRGPLWLRARAQEALGRYDDAERDLTILLQLQPSHAEAWRRLGRILALHGGALEAGRADRALREALAREPAWWDLWLLRARVAVRLGRPLEAERALERYRQEAPHRAGDPEVLRLAAAAKAGGQKRGASPGGRDPPTARALELLGEAQDWLDLGDPADLASGLLRRALAESPGFVDAAAMLYAIAGRVPEGTVKTLWNDGPLLLELARKVRVLGHEEAHKLTAPWIDRAVDLGVPAARLERAALRLGQGDRAGARDDLLAYMTSGPMPGDMDEARVLMASLAGPASDTPERVALAALAEDRADEALRALGTTCDATTEVSRLVALGAIQEWRGDAPKAMACYLEALRGEPEARVPLARLAALAARAPVSQSAELFEKLSLAAERGIADADLALARREPGPSALERLERYLAAASSDDPNRPLAVRMRAEILSGRAASTRRTLGMAVGGALLLALLLLVPLRGTTLVRALARRPEFFPDLARTISDLRHDVLKHRAGVMEVRAPPEEIARVLWEPERASATVALAYESLRRRARAKGITLRRLAREPIFGPLVKDLRRAEQLAREGGPGEGLGEIGARLREVHSERLSGLLARGPRTRLDAAILTRWIRDLEAETRAKGGAWTPPVVHLHGLDLDFPVERAALAAIFSNLLRNAEQAVGDDGSGSVLVKLSEERDPTGRRQLILVVADSSPKPLSPEIIEARETGRGLAIVRDLVREWRGHLAIRSELAPWQKGIHACFPA